MNYREKIENEKKAWRKQDCENCPETKDCFGEPEQCIDNYYMNKLNDIYTNIAVIKIWFKTSPNNLDFDRGYSHALYSVLKLFGEI